MVDVPRRRARSDRGVHAYSRSPRRAAFDATAFACAIDARGHSGLARRVIRAYGEPSENPEFWEAASPRAHFDRVAVPVMIHHGTADESVPIAWSKETVRLLRGEGKDVIFHRYPGEGHAFGAAYAPSMERTVAFFRQHLG